LPNISPPFKDKDAGNRGMTMTKQAQRLRKIIVPLDFSSSSESTIDYASMIAEKFAATLILVHVKKAVPQFQPFQTIERGARRSEADRRIVSMSCLVLGLALTFF
jgi:K+-sensing histidine kinase KdpD